MQLTKPLDALLISKSSKKKKVNITGDKIILGHARLQTINKKGKKNIIVPKKCTTQSYSGII